MKQIEEKLYEIHDSARKNQSVTSGISSTTTGSNQIKLKPFLTVNQVVTASPAFQAVSFFKQLSALEPRANNFLK